MEGDNPVHDSVRGVLPVLWPRRVGLLGIAALKGGKFHPKLNTGERPIAYPYREGKMERTLKSELKVLEIVKRETIATSSRDPVGYSA